MHAELSDSLGNHKHLQCLYVVLVRESLATCNPAKITMSFAIKVSSVPLISVVMCV